MLYRLSRIVWSFHQRGRAPFVLEKTCPRRYILINIGDRHGLTHGKVKRFGLSNESLTLTRRALISVSVAEGADKPVINAHLAERGNLNFL